MLLSKSSTSCNSCKWTIIFGLSLARFENAFNGVVDLKINVDYLKTHTTIPPPQCHSSALLNIKFYQLLPLYGLFISSRLIGVSVSIFFFLFSDTVVYLFSLLTLKFFYINFWLSLVTWLVYLVHSQDDNVIHDFVACLV